MNKYIARLREKSEAHRRRVALGVSAGFTLVVALFWAATIPVRLAALNPQTAAVSEAPTVSIKDTLSQSLNNIGQNFSAATQPSTDSANQGQGYVSDGVLITDTSAPQAATSSTVVQ